MGNDFNIKVVNDYIENFNLTKKDFCKLCGISQKELNLFLSKNDEVLILTISRIAKTINIRMCEMFV